MKGFIFALLLVFPCVLAAYFFRPDPSIFMAGYDVASGDYYLTLYDGSALIDNPEILKKYQKQLKIRKANKESVCKNPLQVIAFNFLCLYPKYIDDNSLKLIHKEKGLIRTLEIGQSYDLPDGMSKAIKIIKNTDILHSQTDFLQRIKQLKQIKGLNILHASTIEPPPATAEPYYDYLVNIYLPLIITPHGNTYNENKELFNEENIRKHLESRLTKEMLQQGIKDYRLTYIGHSNTHHSRPTGSERIRLHPYYNSLASTTGSDRNHLYLSGYRADLFALQIACNRPCADSIEKFQTSDWLPSKISHADFIEKLKETVEHAGGKFNPEYTIDDDTVNLPPDYINAPKKYNLLGKIEVIKNHSLSVNLKIEWEYDLWHALHLPYPTELMRKPVE